MIDEHKDWVCCTDRDAYYCEGCKAEITRGELWKHWQDDETVLNCLDRIAAMKGNNTCEE